MDHPYAIAQCVVIAFLGAVLVVMALWAESRPTIEDRYKAWREAPEGVDATTHTTMGKLL
jgi:hypothetical protein